MKRLRECAGRDLIWRQRSLFSRESELHDRDELCARLSWPQGFINPAAEGETEEGRRQFRRKGLLRSELLIFEAGSESPMATFKSHWRGGGTLQFEDGREFRWRATSWWRRRWQIEASDGTALVRLRQRFAWFRASATLTIEPTATTLPQLPLLVLLGWFLLLRARRGSHAH